MPLFSSCPRGPRDTPVWGGGNEPRSPVGRTQTQTPIDRRHSPYHIKTHPPAATRSTTPSCSLKRPCATSAARTKSETAMRPWRMTSLPMSFPKQANSPRPPRCSRIASRSSLRIWHSCTPITYRACICICVRVGGGKAGESIKASPTNAYTRTLAASTYIEIVAPRNPHRDDQLQRALLGRRGRRRLLFAATARRGAAGRDAAGALAVDAAHVEGGREDLDAPHVAGRGLHMCVYGLVSRTLRYGERGQATYTTDTPTNQPASQPIPHASIDPPACAAAPPPAAPPPPPPPPTPSRGGASRCCHCRCSS